MITQMEFITLLQLALTVVGDIAFDSKTETLVLSSIPHLHLF